MRLEKKAVVITGSTRGIGREIAIMCAEEGADVIISGRDEMQGQEVLQAIQKAGGNATFIKTNIMDSADCKRLIQSCVDRYGKIDGLVNNAGIFPNEELPNVKEDTLDMIFDTNYKGAFFCVQEALKYMSPQRSGSIVNIGSTHWEMGGKGLPAYACSKGALHTLTKHVSFHFAKDRVRCNWISVGWVLSEGEKQRLYNRGLDDDYIKEQAKKYIPFGDYQTARDIAYACVYLLSDEARNVTSSDIEVTGGFDPKRISE